MNQRVFAALIITQATVIFLRANGWISIKQTDSLKPSGPFKGPNQQVSVWGQAAGRAAYGLLLQAEYSGETSEWTSGAWLLFIKSIND